MLLITVLYFTYAVGITYYFNRRHWRQNCPTYIRLAITSTSLFFPVVTIGNIALMAGVESLSEPWFLLLKIATIIPMIVFAGAICFFCKEKAQQSARRRTGME